MPQPNHPRRIAAVILAAVLLCLGGFAGAVLSIGARVDARAELDSVRQVATRLADLRRTLSGTASDYNHWTEAHARMMAGDLGWVYDNYGVTAVMGTVFDGLVLFDGPFAAPLSWREGEPEAAPSFLSPATLARLRVEVAGQALGQRRTFDMMALVGGRATLLSATRTQPDGADRLGGLDPSALPVAVLARTLRADDLYDLGAALMVDGMMFRPLAEPALANLPVTGPDGEVLGHLSWAPARPGRDLLIAMAPVLAAAGAAFAGLGCAAAWLARVHAGRLLREEAQARRLARTDAMTGLPNRLAFNEHLAAVERAGAPQAAVLFIDLNGFKRINDTVGHAGGDAVVAGLAARLSRLAGPGAFVARLGGDEFVLLVSGGTGVAARAGRLTEDVLRCVAEPFPVLGRAMRLTLAQGLALRDTPALPLDELVRRADVAMYRAKRDRSAGARPYSPDLDAPVAPADAGAGHASIGTLRRLPFAPGIDRGASSSAAGG